MKIVSLIFLSLLLISCSNKDKEIQRENKHRTNQTKTVQKGTPTWITNPNLGVKYGVVGIALYQKNKKLQRLSAIANGKRKLSEQFRYQLQQQSPIPFEKNSKMIGSTFNIVALQSSENITKNATIKDTYKDLDGTLYLWIVIY